MSEIKYNYNYDKNEYDFMSKMDGEIVNTSALPMLVICEKCNYEIQEEAVIKDGRPFHYNCSGIEF